MPDILTVISRRWKWMLVITVLITALALVVALLSPKQYLSVATALPGNSVLSDRANIFNNNIQNLNAQLGSADELDRIEGTALLDTIFLATVDRFKLADYYRSGNGAAAREKAVKTLRKKSKIARSGYGELKVMVWDKNNQLAADLANSMLQDLQDLHQHLLMEQNKTILQQLKTAYAGYAVDSASAANSFSFKEAERYRQLIGEYQLAVQTTPKVLLVVEKARPAIKPDKPNMLQTAAFAFAGALALSLLLAVWLPVKTNGV